MMTSCYLEYHFQHPYLSHTSIAFDNPVAILQTHDVTMVQSILQQVNDYLEQGYYVAGYMSYEAAPTFQPTMKVHKDASMPLVWFGIFLKPIQPKEHLPLSDYESIEWEPDTNRTEYDKAIAAIHQEIEKGNTYQVNYTLRLHSDFINDDYAYFHQLRRAQQANYSAYLNIGSKKILSSSPELFFAWNGDKIITKPMKGTIQRGLTLEDDKLQYQKLKSSKKDQSENVMIVDLLRNDIGRIAKVGTVHVPKLFDIESYPTVFQMTSTIEADTKKETTVSDIFNALFPCGSITGAPKISTMAIINRLEKSPREVYCGAIGYFLPNKTAVFNVPIRTVWIDTETQRATYGVGGGVTWESTAHGEYKEVIAKGKILTTNRQQFDLLESLLLEDGQIYLLDNHLQRLKRSVNYFHYLYDEKTVRDVLESTRQNYLYGRYKLRLLLEQNGRVTVDVKPINPFKQPLIVRLSSHSVSKQNTFLYHKTTNRDVYKEVRRGNEVYFDILLWNEDGHITEFTNGNIVCQLDGQLVTPPIEDGLLAGTFREILVKNNQIVECSMTIKDVERADNVWLINSVRRWAKVTLFNDDPTG